MSSEGLLSTMHMCDDNPIYVMSMCVSASRKKREQVLS